MSDTAKATVGVDFGTESARAVLVDVETGQELATAVHRYASGVIDQRLPGTGKSLPLDWALQDPDDYLEALGVTVRSVLDQSRIDAVQHQLGAAKHRERTASAEVAPRQIQEPLAPLAVKVGPHPGVLVLQHFGKVPGHQDPLLGEHGDAIARFEAGYRGRLPWLAGAAR